MIVVSEGDRNFLYPFANPLSLHQLFEGITSMHPFRDLLSASTFWVQIFRSTHACRVNWENSFFAQSGN